MTDNQSYKPREEILVRFGRICDLLGKKRKDILYALLSQWIDSVREKLLWKTVILERQVMSMNKKVTTPSVAEVEAADIDLGDEDIDLGSDDMDEDLDLGDIDLDELEGAVTTEALEKAYNQTPTAGGVTSEEINVLSKRVADVSHQVSTATDIILKKVADCAESLRLEFIAIREELKAHRALLNKPVAAAPAEEKPAPAAVEEKASPKKRTTTPKNGAAASSFGDLDIARLAKLVATAKSGGVAYPGAKLADALARKVASDADTVLRWLKHEGHLTDAGTLKVQ